MPSPPLWTEPKVRSVQHRNKFYQQPMKMFYIWTGNESRRIYANSSILCDENCRYHWWRERPNLSGCPHHFESCHRSHRFPQVLWLALLFETKHFVTLRRRKNGRIQEKKKQQMRLFYLFVLTIERFFTLRVVGRKKRVEGFFFNRGGFPIVFYSGSTVRFNL